MFTSEKDMDVLPCLEGIDCFARYCACRLSDSLSDRNFDTKLSLEVDSINACSEIRRKQLFVLNTVRLLELQTEVNRGTGTHRSTQKTQRIISTRKICFPNNYKSTFSLSMEFAMHTRNKITNFQILVAKFQIVSWNRRITNKSKRKFKIHKCYMFSVPNGLKENNLYQLSS